MDGKEKPPSTENFPNVQQPNVTPKFGRKPSISAELSSDITNFLNTASKGSDKFDIKQGFYCEEEPKFYRPLDQVEDRHKSRNYPRDNRRPTYRRETRHHRNTDDENTGDSRTPPEAPEPDLQTKHLQSTKFHVDNETKQASPKLHKRIASKPRVSTVEEDGEISDNDGKKGVDEEDGIVIDFPSKVAEGREDEGYTKLEHEESRPKVHFHIEMESDGTSDDDSDDGSQDGTTPQTPTPKEKASLDSNSNRRPSFGSRRRQHDHGPSENSSFKRRVRRGSEVQLKIDAPAISAELREEEGPLEDVDLEDISSHRFGQSGGLHHRKKRRQSVPNLRQGKRRVTDMMKDLHPSVDHTPHEMFVELIELLETDVHQWVWKEKARWIKFEEDIEEGAERWGKPHVASLSFHSLLELRKCLDQAVVMLDIDVYDFPAVANIVVDKFVVMEMVDPEHQGNILKALLHNHRHLGDRAYARRNSQIFYDQMSKRRSAPEMKPSTPHKPSVGFKDLPKTASSPAIASKHPDVEGQITSNGHTTPGENPSPRLARRRSAAELLQGFAQRVKESENPILKRIPEGSEGAVVLVGSVGFLDRPVMAFVRLSNGELLDNVLEVPIPVRFVVIILGPERSNVNYHQMGRSISTLLADTTFRDMAYRADDRQDLMDAINEFLDDSLVLPPGKLDQKTLLPIMDMALKKAEKDKRQKKEKEPAEQSPADHDEAPKRTKRLFGGLVNDVKRRYPKYLSDITDAFTLQCLAAFFFIYFACLSPAITFGGLLGETTDQLIGVSEMLVITCVGGIVMALLAGQPLVMVGFTGPILVFEKALVQICNSADLDYLSFRVWIGFWVTIIGFLMVMFEGSFLVRYITRFVEEIFATLISLIFIYEVFTNLYYIFRRHPLLPYYPECPPELPVNNSWLDANISTNGSGEYVTWMSDLNSTEYGNNSKEKPERQPNTALLCLILTFGTFIIAYALKFFRNSKFFGRNGRRAFGDFGVPIAILVMVVVDVLIKDTYTEKLDVPESGFTPTAPDKRGWFINPLGVQKSLPIWAFFLAALPAMLLCILMFMETLLTSMNINKKERNLKKGTGYHLDILLISILATVAGILGCPMLCVAHVRSVTHVSALSVCSKTHAPGEKAKLVRVLEQRVTGLFVHILIGVSVLLGPVLRYVPLAVLFGVFLYMGVASMSGVQLIERVELFFRPVKHHPNVGYVRRVRTWKMHVYTLIQLVCLAVLWAVKSTQGALAFPFILILLVPVRLKVLKYAFSQEELSHLDRDDGGPDTYDDDEPDFYEQARKPW